MNNKVMKINIQKQWVFACDFQRGILSNVLKSKERECVFIIIVIQNELSIISNHCNSRVYLW